MNQPTTERSHVLCGVPTTAHRRIGNWQEWYGGPNTTPIPPTPQPPRLHTQTPETGPTTRGAPLYVSSEGARTRPPIRNYASRPFSEAPFEPAPSSYPAPNPPAPARAASARAQSDASGAGHPGAGTSRTRHPRSAAQRAGYSGPRTPRAGHPRSRAARTGHAGSIFGRVACATGGRSFLSWRSLILPGGRQHRAIGPPGGIRPGGWGTDPSQGERNASAPTDQGC